MTGGMFIGTNVDGRNSEGIGSGSIQASMYLTTGSTTSAGTIVHVENADGESLVPISNGLFGVELMEI